MMKAQLGFYNAANLASYYTIQSCSSLPEIMCSCEFPIQRVLLPAEQRLEQDNSSLVPQMLSLLLSPLLLDVYHHKLKRERNKVNGPV